MSELQAITRGSSPFGMANNVQKAQQTDFGLVEPDKGGVVVSSKGDADAAMWSAILCAGSRSAPGGLLFDRTEGKSNSSVFSPIPDFL